MLRIEDTVYVNGEEYKRTKKMKPKSYEFMKFLEKSLPKRIEFAEKNGDETLANELKHKLEYCEQYLKKESNKENPSRKHLKHSVKKRSDAEAKKMIMEYVREVKEGKRKGARVTSLAVAKEDVAYSLKLPVSQVEKIFMVLNREGVLSQRNAQFVHDSTRNNFAYGPYSGWASDYYKILI